MESEQRRSLNLWLVTEIEDEMECQWVNVKELRQVRDGLAAGYDPMLHTEEEAGRMERALSGASRLLADADRQRRFPD